VFGQTFDLHDLVIVAVLVVLEGVLSIDNALVLGLLARRLPKHLQKKALTYGLIGAFLFRIIAVATAAWLLHWRWVKLLGGLYLLYVAGKYFLFGDEPSSEPKIQLDAQGKPILPEDEYAEETFAADVQRGTHSRKFWLTVGAIEMTDIAFAVDSIVAAIGVVGPPPKPDQTHPKLWVVLTGGMLGVVLMRFAAVIFIKLLETFPRFETSAYLLVTVIGAKLVADWLINTEHDPDRLNLHSPGSLGFWAFWVTMFLAFMFGFLPRRSAQPPTAG
jgi:YkoY family integral membrane protein